MENSPDLQQDKLVLLGFTDRVLNGWKLKLYGNVDESVKYYESDSFCFEYFVFGCNCCNCKIKDKHKYTATQLLANGDVDKCIVMLEYLEWYFETKFDNLTLTYVDEYKCKIYEYLGDSYKNLHCGSKCNVNDNYIQSSKYYSKSFELSKNKNIRCLIKHAKLLDYYLNNWTQSMRYFLQAIKIISEINDKNMVVETHFSFAKSLKDHGMFNESMYHYIECIKNDVNINLNNLIYFEQLSYCMFRQ